MARYSVTRLLPFLLAVGLLVGVAAASAAPGLSSGPTAQTSAKGHHHGSKKHKKKHSKKHKRKKDKKKSKKPSPYSGKFLPKGTPYAAEVRVEIQGSYDVNEDSTQDTLGFCGDGRSQIEHWDNSFDINWNYSFNQVTVPVATKAELGKARKRLNVPAQPTSDGVDHGSNGGSHVEGYGPSIDEACDKVKYSANSTMTFRDKPIVYKMPLMHRYLVYYLQSPLIGFSPPTFYRNTAEPENVPFDAPFEALADGIPEVQEPSGNSSDSDILKYFRNDLSWNSVAAVWNTNDLVALRNKKSIVMPKLERDGQLSPCEEADSDGKFSGLKYTCQSGFQIEYKIALKRHFLYKTSRRYRRK